MLNRLYDDCNIAYNQWLVLTEIISVKNHYDSIFVFKSSRFKKMEQIRFARNIYSYMGNVVDEKKHVVRFYKFVLLFLFYTL